MKEFDVGKWVNDSYVRKAFAELGLDYEKQRASFENYEVKGEDTFCKKPITEPRKAGELWVDGEGIVSFSSAACTLGAYADLKAKGKKINVAYVFDTERGIKLFADQAFFSVGAAARSRRSCSRRTPRPMPPRSAARSSISTMRSSRR